MRCVVTGGAGFLGSHLSESLLSRGHEVCIIDDLFRGKKVNMAGCRGMPDFHFILGDCSKRELLDKAEQKLGGVDVVFHLAAINGTRWFYERPDLVVKVNINSIASVIDFASDAGAKLVFTSSPEAYGEQEKMPLDESSESRFPSPHQHLRHSYGASKYLSEVLIQHAVREKGLDGRIIRPFNAYGPRLKGDSYGQVAAIFLDQCLNENPITIHGDGTQTRSLTWIDDIISGIVALGELDVGLDGSKLAGASFNIGSSEEISMNDLAEICLSISGSNAGSVHQGEYLGDSQRRLPDTTVAESALGWSTSMSLRDGIEYCWQWLCAERDSD